MSVVYFPRPQGKRDPDRAAGALLLAQVKHLQQAEKSLPPKYHSGIFSHAIQTEGEAADYIGTVTEAIHRAQDNAAAARARKTPKRREVIELAAVAEETSRPKKKKRAKKKTGKGEPNR